jgi:TolB-like protein/DNA-binding winged helix-turn-helix (wHTH) protein
VFVFSLPQAVQVGQWRVEPELDLIVRDGHSTKIEPRAMRVLLFLIRRAGHVVTVRELLDEAWPDVVVGPDSVYQAIALLRRTLGDDRQHPSYIAHIPRKGYRLIAPIAPPSPAASVASAAPAARPAAPVDPALHMINAPPVARALEAPVAPVQRAGPHRLAGASAWATLGIALAAIAAAYFLVRVAQRAPPFALAASRFATANIPPAARGSPPAPSIAVLPFIDMSEKQDLGYFADGLTEELIDLLSRGSDLRVPARTSSFFFKGKPTTVHAIASALGVDNLLEGSVRRSGHRVRVTAQLIRADNGYHLWSQTYDRELDEIFTVEDDIAQTVTKTLQAKLNAGYTAAGVIGANSETHGLLLQCQFFLQRNTTADADKAVDCYRRLLALAPQDATAWAGYADALWRQPSLHGVPPPEMRAARGAARQAAQQALALDVSLAAPHAILAMYHRVIDHDWAAAQMEVSAALTADPADPSGLLAAARLAITLGQLHRALELLERARARDPLNFIPYARLSEIYLYQGRLQEAEAAARRRVDLSPDGHGGYTELADLLLARGQPVAALASVRQEPDVKERLIGLALVYHALGRNAEAGTVLTELTRRYGDALLEIADVYADRGEIDRAFAILDRAFDAGDQELLTVRIDRHFKSLHADPRYSALLRRLKLPEDEGTGTLPAASPRPVLNATATASTPR